MLPVCRADDRFERILTMSMFVNMAAKGSKAARVRLYDQNHKMVYFLCLRFLKNEKTAEAATRQIFANIWESLDPTTDIRLQLIVAASRYCKDQLLEQDEKAFDPIGEVPAKMPAAKADADPTEMYVNYMLSKLDNLHLFVFLLKSTFGLNNTEVGELLDLDSIVVNKLMNEAEDLARHTVNNMKSRKDCPIQHYEHVIQLLQHQMMHIDVPAALTAQIMRDIEETAVPTSKVKWIAMIALFAVLLAATLLPAAQNVLSHMDKTYAVIEVDLSPIERALPDDIDPVGSIVVELDASIAPKTVANFIDLAESGFYDGLTFHRVMYDFMIQGGDPNGNGTGGSDNPIEGEFYLNGFINPLSHTRGVISMARRGDDFNSATSQFFIMHTSTYSSSLDGQYAAFGWVISGMDYVDAIAAFTYTSDGNGTVPAEYQPKINKITIHESL